MKPTFIATHPFCLSHFVIDSTEPGGAGGEAGSLASACVLHTLLPPPRDPVPLQPGHICEHFWCLRYTGAILEPVSLGLCHQERVAAASFANQDRTKQWCPSFPGTFSSKPLTQQQKSPNPGSHRFGGPLSRLCCSLCWWLLRPCAIAALSAGTRALCGTGVQLLGVTPRDIH